MRCDGGSLDIVARRLGAKNARSMPWASFRYEHLIGAWTLIQGTTSTSNETPHCIIRYPSISQLTQFTLWQRGIEEARAAFRKGCRCCSTPTYRR